MVLALAHAGLKDIEQAKKACVKAADLLKPTGADAALRPLVREVVITLGTDLAEAKELIAAVAGELPPALNEAIAQHPEKADGYLNRGTWHGERGRWREAVADYAEAYRLNPDNLTGMWIGILLAHTGDLHSPLSEEQRHELQAINREWLLAHPPPAALPAYPPPSPADLFSDNPA